MKVSAKNTEKICDKRALEICTKKAQPQTKKIILPHSRDKRCMASTEFLLHTQTQWRNYAIMRYLKI